MIFKCKYFGIKCQSEESVDSYDGLTVRKNLIKKGWHVNDRVYSEWTCKECTESLKKIGDKLRRQNKRFFNESQKGGK